MRDSKGLVARLCLSRRRGRCRYRFLAVQLANRKRLDLPRRDLHFGFVFPFANLLLVDVAHESPRDIQVVALFQFVRRIFRKAIPNDDAMPLGFFPRLLVLVLPSGLGGEREDGECPSRLLCGFAFWTFP